jgi:hypothetical protein
MLDVSVHCILVRTPVCLKGGLFFFASSHWVHAALVKCRICPHSSVLPFGPSVVSGIQRRVLLIGYDAYICVFIVSACWAGLSLAKERYSSPRRRTRPFETYVHLRRTFLQVAHAASRHRTVPVSRLLRASGDDADGDDGGVGEGGGGEVALPASSGSKLGDSSGDSGDAASFEAFHQVCSIVLHCHGVVVVCCCCCCCCCLLLLMMMLLLRFSYIVVLLLPFCSLALLHCCCCPSIRDDVSMFFFRFNLPVS